MKITYIRKCCKGKSLQIHTTKYISHADFWGLSQFLWSPLQHMKPQWDTWGLGNKWLIYTPSNYYSTPFYPYSCPFTPPPFSFPSSLSTALLLSFQTCLVWGQLEEKIPSFPWRISSLSLHLNFLHPNISSLTTIYKYGSPKNGTEWRIPPQGDQFRPIMHLTDKPNLLDNSTSF